MKVAHGFTVYNEDISQIRRVIENTKNIRDELIIIVHKDAYPHVKEYLKKEATVYLEQDLDQSYPEEDRNTLLSHMKNEWALLLDCDEFLDAKAIRFIENLEKPQANGFIIKRVNIRYWEKEELELGVEYPDSQIRLFRSKFRYSGNVHQHPMIDPGLKEMDGNMIHDWLTRLVPECKRKALIYENCKKKYSIKN